MIYIPKIEYIEKMDWKQWERNLIGFETWVEKYKKIREENVKNKRYGTNN